MTCDYSSFVLLATAPPRCAKSHGSRPVWWLEPYQEPHLYTPLPALSLNHPVSPCPVPVRGCRALGSISALCKVPRVLREPLGWHTASRHHHTMMPPRCWAVLAGSRQRGGGDHVPCRERAVLPPRAAPAGCPMAAPRVHCRGKEPATPTAHLT